MLWSVVMCWSARTLCTRMPVCCMLKCPYVVIGSEMFMCCGGDGRLSSSFLVLLPSRWG